MGAVIRVTSSEDAPLKGEKRKLGAINLGLYCRNEACRQFISLAPLPQNPVPFQIESDPPGSGLWLECPMCTTRQHRRDEELELVKLTERSKQRPSAH